MNAISIADVKLPTVMRVMPENVSLLWEQLEPLIAAPLSLVSTHTVEDVRRAIMAMRAQLWVQMDGRDVVAAVTTEFVDYPAGLYVRVWTAGAIPSRSMDEDAFFDVLDQWRDRNGCVGFEAIGRHGWLRRFKDARVEGLVMRWRVS